MKQSPREPTSIKTVLVAGASGYVGRQVVSNLVDKGFQVLCIFRCHTNIEASKAFYGSAPRNLTSNLNNLEELKQFSISCPDFDAVISCIGNTIFSYYNWNI